MANDLLRHHLRVGISERQVRALLGPPGFTGHPKGAPARGRRILYWDTGMGLLPLTQPGYLEVEVDRKGRVVGYRWRGT